MVWINLILAIISLLIKLPDIVETIQRLIESLRGVKPLQRPAEAMRLLTAIEKKLAAGDDPKQAAAFECPLVAYEAKFHERYGKLA